MGNKRDNAKKDHNWFRWRPPLCVVTGYHFLCLLRQSAFESCVDNSNESRVSKMLFP